MTPELVEQIISWVIQILPGLIAVITTVCGLLKVFAQLKTTKAEVNKKVLEVTDVSELKGQVKAVLEENYELKKQIKELLQKIDKVKRS